MRSSFAIFGVCALLTVVCGQFFELGKRQPGDAVIGTEYKATEKTVNPQNHTLSFDFVTDNTITFIRFDHSEAFERGVLQDFSTTHFQIDLIATNANYLSADMTVYGFGAAAAAEEVAENGRD